MLREALTPRRLIVTAALTAGVATMSLMVLLARPDVMIRLANGPFETNSRLAQQQPPVTVSELGDVIVGAREPLPLLPAIAEDNRRAGGALFAVGDRVAVGAVKGEARTLEVVDVREAGPAIGAVTGTSGEPAPLRFMLVTCRTLDNNGRPVAGPPVRFVIAADLGTPHGSLSPVPGTL